MPIDARSISLTGLFLLALLYTLYFARAFLVPVIFALLLSHLLRPLVRSLKRAGIPEGAGAGLVLAAFLGTTAFGVFQLWGPAARWVAEAPRTLPRMGAKLEKVLRPVQRVSQSAEKVAEVADVDGQKVLQVEVRGRASPKRSSAAPGSCSGRPLSSPSCVPAPRIRGPVPRQGDQGAAAARGQEESRPNRPGDPGAGFLLPGHDHPRERHVRVVIGVAMHLLGMPNPVLWGVVAAVTNFIPFVGALACTAILGSVALLHFERGASRPRRPGLQALNLLDPASSPRTSWARGSA